MAALAERDAEGVLRFLALAGEIGGDEPFTPAVLAELGKLIRADWVTYCEQDRIRRRTLRGVGRPGELWGDGGVEISYWEIVDEHPICMHHSKGDLRALMLSDLLSLTKLRQTRVYALWFRAGGVERELTMPIPSPPWHSKTFLFDRRHGHDFTERDRLVLQRLQPHLGRLWRAAQTRQRLRAATTALESASPQDRRGLILLASDGRIEFASPAARRLMRDYFGARREAELPPTLTAWVESGLPTLTRRLGDGRLTVDRSGDSLLLEETRNEFGLTPREREILAWVGQGKTNPEIAEILWIAPATVRKHLENVYEKLGVRTRTAAVTRVLGLLDRMTRDETTAT
jgi:DNA-binding CsgD family transcriptional regulator